MYTIIMNKDKSLTTAVKATLYQREKLADKIQFLLPQRYEDIEIKDCTILLKYMDQGNVAHAEKLSVEQELYKDRVRCIMSVDTNLTRFAGDVIAHLDFLKLNSDDGIYESVLSSGEVTITISSAKDYFAYCADESLDVINKTMLELEAKAKALESAAEIYNEKKADNIIKTTQDGNIKVQLTSNGTPIGDEVTVYDNGAESAAYIAEAIGTSETDLTSAIATAKSEATTTAASDAKEYADDLIAGFTSITNAEIDGPFA